MVHSDFVLYVNINVSSCPAPTVIASFKVWNDMHVQSFDSNQERDISELAWLLGDRNIVTRWSQLPNICSHLVNSCQAPATQSVVQQIVTRLKELIHDSI